MYEKIWKNVPKTVTHTHGHESKIWNGTLTEKLAQKKMKNVTQK